jgi:hypothetical protein
MKLVFIEQPCSLNTSFNSEESSSLKRVVFIEELFIEEKFFDEGSVLSGELSLYIIYILYNVWV